MVLKDGCHSEEEDVTGERGQANDKMKTNFFNRVMNESAKELADE